MHARGITVKYSYSKEISKSVPLLQAPYWTKTNEIGKYAHLFNDK